MGNLGKMGKMGNLGKYREKVTEKVPVGSISQRVGDPSDTMTEEVNATTSGHFSSGSLSFVHSHGLLIDVPSNNSFICSSTAKHTTSD